MRKNKQWMILFSVLLVCLIISVSPSNIAFASGGSYSEDFSDGQAQGWSTVTGTWSVTSGHYENTLVVNPAIAIYDNDTWDTGFTFASSQYSAYAGSGNYVGVLYNYEDSSNYYYVYFNPTGSAEMHKVISGTDSLVDSASYSGGGYHVQFNLAIIRSGDTTTVKVNGTTVFDSVSQTELGAGKIGLYERNNIPHVDDISVVPNVPSSYSEDFSDGLAQGWSSVSGTWSVSNGYYHVAEFQPYKVSVYNNNEWDTNYAYTARVYTASTSGNKTGLVYNYQDSSNYYYVLFNDVGSSELHKLVGGTDTTIDTESYTGFGSGNWIDVEVDRSGNNTTVKVNGNPIYSNVSQTEFDTGKIGLIGYNFDGRYDDIALTPTYAEDFGDGLAQDWTSIDGTWSVTSGYYQVAEFQPYQVAVYDNAAWDTDFAYSASVYTSGTSGNKDGLVYNFQDSNNYYYVLFNDAGNSELHKMVGGTDTTIDTASYTGYGGSTWIDVEIDRSGDNTTVSVNGHAIYANIAQTELGSGKIGLIGYNFDGRYDDLSVGALGQVDAGDFPKIAGIYSSGPRQYDNATEQAALAKHDLIMLSVWTGWHSNGIQAAVQAIKAINPDILVGNYTNVMEVSTNPSNYDATALKTKMESEVGPNGVGDWWARDSLGNHVSEFTGYDETNITEFVAPDANGDTFAQYFAHWVDDAFFSPVPEFDFMYSDNAFWKPRSVADWDGDGTDDLTTSSTVQAYYRKGMADYWDELRTLEPNLAIIGNSDGDGSGHGFLRESEYQNKLDGALFESAMGQSWSQETLYGWDTMMGNYRSLMDNTIIPHLVLFNIKGDATDYQTVRYGLTSALMENGYFSYNTLAGSYHDDAITWFDEYDVDLGKAIDRPQRSAWSNGVYMRRFENGMALVNPKGNGTQTVTIPAGYKHFSGTQDSTVNDGSNVTSITLGERDGVILINQ